MSEFGSGELGAVKAAAEQMRRGDRGAAAELMAGNEQEGQREENQARREGQDAKVLQDIVRVTQEMEAIQAVLDEEAALVTQQEKMQAVAGTPAAEIHAKVIATREETIRQLRLKLDPKVTSLDADTLKGVLASKQAIKDELESKLQTVTGSI